MRRALALVAALLVLVACGALPAPIARLIATPTATLPPTATATATPTATPTPTVTPTPTPLPLTLSLTVEPESPAQGQTVVVRATLDRAAEVSALFDGEPLTFFYESATEAWALAAVPPGSATGERPLVAEAVASDGIRSRVGRTVVVQRRAFEDQNIDVPTEQSLLLEQGLRPAEDRYLAARLDEPSPEPLWGGPLTLPAEGWFSSPYGARRSYAGGPVIAYHGGLDIAAAEGTPIYAAAEGVVLMAEPLYVRGNAIILDHGLGVSTLYFHLATMDVAVGQRVARGEQIGTMGNTGLSTGAHLHWEVRIGEDFVDPSEWLARGFP